MPVATLNMDILAHMPALLMHVFAQSVVCKSA